MINQALELTNTLAKKSIRNQYEQALYESLLSYLTAVLGKATDVAGEGANHGNRKTTKDTFKLVGAS